MDIEDEIAELDSQNGKRMADLMAGKFGVGVQLQHGTFEFLKITVYLEHLLRERLAEANLDYAHKVSDALDKLETQAREAAILHGTGVIGNGHG